MMRFEVAFDCIAGALDISLGNIGIEKTFEATGSPFEITGTKDVTIGDSDVFSGEFDISSP